MLKLSTQTRSQLRKHMNDLRKLGQLPASAYGPKIGTYNITIDSKDFGLMFKDAGFNKLLGLELEGKEYKALVKEVQLHPVTGRALHVSFYVVDMDQKLEAEVPVEIIGLSPAVKNNLGFLEVTHNTLEVRCLPADLPGKITVDVSKLEQVGEGVTVGDILKVLGDKVELTLASEQGLDTRIAVIAPPQKQEEEVAAPVVSEEAATTEATTEAEKAE